MSKRAPSAAFAAAISKRNLIRIYAENVKDGTHRGRDGTSPESLESEIEAVCTLLSLRLRTGGYRYTQYREHLRSKGAGKKPRVISIPTARDRIALRALADCLIEIYPFTGGVIPQVRVREVAEELKSRRFDAFARIDVEEFYPGIRHATLATELSRRIRKIEIKNAIMAAVQTPTVPDRAKRRAPTNVGVPQGLAISNVLSELVIHPVDDYFSTRSDCAYFRFVDDILILCNRDSASLLAEEARQLLNQQGLSAHPVTGSSGKSHVGMIDDQFEYLGYKFSPTTISVRESSVVGLEARLAREFTRYRRDSTSDAEVTLRRLVNRINLAVTGCVWDRKAFGWLSYFRQTNDLTLVKRLDLAITRYRDRFEIPAEVRLKSFMRAYWAVTHPHGKDRDYIPNYDNLSVPKMREVLKEYMAPEEVHRLHDHAVPRTFRRLMTKLTSELEQDIGSKS